MKTAPNENYDEQPQGLWSKFKDRFGFGEYDDEDVCGVEDDDATKKRGATLRVHSTRINHVSVWLSVNSIDNARQAADGLKEGNQQIVNLEKATPEVFSRIIDFLNGVIYALGGNVEKVGDKVYLFTPANYIIDVENGDISRKVNNIFHDN